MPTADLLVDHLRSIGRHIPHLVQEAALALTRMVAAAVSACVAPLLPSETRHRSDTISLDRVKRYLDEHLGSPKLGPADICRDLAISRPTLYRMFAGLGGVAAYIQNQRLAKAYAVLAHAGSSHARARDVASACGFVSAAHFHRSFRNTFGITPGDVRAEQPKRRTFLKHYASIDFADVWIAQLAGSPTTGPTPEADTRHMDVL
jgi:AraC-like DNA-binding protein